MATTSRIKYTKIARTLTPIFLGFFIILLVSTLVTGILISQRQKEEEKANNSRNQYIEEYNVQIVDFSTRLDEALSLSIKQPPVNEYITDLQRIKDLNTSLTNLANDIYQSSLVINGLADNELKKDRVRIENHFVYDELVLSLQDYHDLLQSHYTVISCFEDINIEAKNSIIVESIDTCSKLRGRITPFSERSGLEEFTKYWELYFAYWDTVKSIHGKPKTSEIPQLKNKLESDFTSLKKQQPVMEDAMSTYFIEKYLEQVND